MRDLNLPHGPSRYIIERCPYCKRRLAEWFEGDDHVTVLHNKAEFVAGSCQEHGIVSVTDTGSAYCLRWLCRVRAKRRELAA